MEDFIDFSNNSYCVIRKCISNDLIKYLQIESKLFENLICSIENKSPLSFADSVKKSFSYYAAPFTESMLLYLKEKIESIVNKNLEVTYSYMRIYYSNAELERHIDRESCEYSITLCIKNDVKPWDIWFETKNGEVSISLQEGDMIIYKGMELPHWRKKYEGNEQIQFFLHYIDKQGLYINNILDKRQLLCTQKKRTYII